MSNKVPIIAAMDLEGLHTESLMSRRNALLKCDESLEQSDQDLLSTPPGFIEFKNTHEWRKAYSEIKAILSKREDIPSKKERKAMRQAKARASK